jgi:secreted trypsin-like serine protease
VLEPKQVAKILAKVIMVVWEQTDGTYTIVGVVSFGLGYKCGEPNIPVVYA